MKPLFVPFTRKATPFERFSAVVTPQRCMKFAAIWGVWNLGLGVGNLVRWNLGQLGLNVASIGVCIGSVWLFKEVLKMEQQNKEMRDIRIKLEADIWDMEHGKTLGEH